MRGRCLWLCPWLATSAPPPSPPPTSFHGEQPLNYAYGADWLIDVLQFHAAAEKTLFDLPPATIEILARFMVDGNAHMSWGLYYDFSLTGRGIDRPGSSFDVPFSSSSVRSIANATSDGTLSAALMAWADRLDGAPSATPLVGARYYWSSDFSTHHRPTWGASFKAHGNNTLWTVVGGECDNSEDVLGEHLGDGVLSVYGDLSPAGVGREYITAAGDNNAVFPLWDWQGLNGITVEHNVPVEECIGDVWRVVNTHFVGAACDGLYTAFAYDTATHALTARRAFFFFDAVIIATASNITDAAPVNVRTALASRLLPHTPALESRLAVAYSNGTVVPSLSDGNYTWPVADVAWLHAGRIGYVPALLGDAGGLPTLLGTSVGTVSGDWHSIGAFHGTSVGRLLTAHLDHSGGAPDGGARAAAYSYAVLPATAAADMPAAAATLGGVERACVVSTPEVQGAADPLQGVTQVVFFAAGSYACTAASGWSITVSSPAPAIVLVREDAGSVTVWAAHPFLAGPAAAVVTVSRAASGAGCSPAAAGGGTTFSVPYPLVDDDRGATVSRSCAKAT